MKRALLVLVLALVLIALFVLLRPQTQPASIANDSPPTSERAREPQRAQPQNEPRNDPRNETRAAAPQTVERPRIVLAPPKRPPREEPIHIAEKKGLVDKRGIKSTDTARELEALNYGMETLDDDIEECLEQWASTSSTISGKAMVGFQVSPDGLTSAWIDGAEQIPFGPRTCIANAVYGIDWSRIVDHPAEITRRYELDAPRAEQQ
jgi:hypothetical protein